MERKEARMTPTPQETSRETLVRKFEASCSGLYCFDFLATKGFKVTTKQGLWYYVTSPLGGRPKKMNKYALLALNDDERIKSGLEPITLRRTV